MEIEPISVVQESTFKIAHNLSSIYDIVSYLVSSRYVLKTSLSCVYKTPFETLETRFEDIFHPTNLITSLFYLNSPSSLLNLFAPVKP